MRARSIKTWLQTMVALSVLVCMAIAGSFGSTSLRAQAQSQLGSRSFPETGHTVNGPILEYWEMHGGLTQQGYPISEEMQEVSDINGITYTTQYFERAVFELHPENQAPNDVLLSLVGVLQYGSRYGTAGAPNQMASTDNPVTFTKETGKTLGGKFRQYWETHGGLMQQGYPISDELQEVSALNGKTYTVQYFQRAVFEYHPENAGTPYEVLLSQLGTFRYRAKYMSGTPSPGNPPQCWNNIQVPQDNDVTPLADISALPNHEAWAVGERQVNGTSQTVALHFHGTTWETMSSPNPGKLFNTLGGVVAVAQDNVWAVGSYGDGGDTRPRTKALILHWDGKEWKVVPSPNPGGDYNGLYTISALASDDIWAAGATTPTNSSDQPFLLHWDGKAWTEKPSKNLTGSTFAQSIVAVAHDDVWVTGVNNGSHLFAMHWDGGQWTPSEYLEKAINLTDYDVGELRGVTAVGPNEVWAVGYYRNFSSKVDAFIVRWDGQRWSRVVIPSGGSSGASAASRILTGVSASASNDIWAVGSQGGSETVDNEPLVLHWNGNQWNSDPVSKPFSGTKAAFRRVSATNASVWAVGSYGSSQVAAGGLVSVRDRGGACMGSTK